MKYWVISAKGVVSLPRFDHYTVVGSSRVLVGFYQYQTIKHWAAGFWIEEGESGGGGKKKEKQKFVSLWKRFLGFNSFENKEQGTRSFRRNWRPSTLQSHDQFTTIHFQELMRYPCFSILNRYILSIPYFYWTCIPTW